MDKLGERIIREWAEIRDKRARAAQLEREVALLRSEANETERLLELARLEALT